MASDTTIIATGAQSISGSSALRLAHLAFVLVGNGYRLITGPKAGTDKALAFGAQLAETALSRTCKLLPVTPESLTILPAWHNELPAADIFIYHSGDGADEYRPLQHHAISCPVYNYIVMPKPLSDLYGACSQKTDSFLGFDSRTYVQQAIFAKAANLYTIKGDLIALFKAGEIDVMVHGCNCFHRMGSGIAKQIRAAYPNTYWADRDTPYGSAEKLGTYSMASAARNGGEGIIVNAYTQFNYGRDEKLYTRYDAVDGVFARIREDFAGKAVGFPYIGAGLSGGDWLTIAPIIYCHMKDQPHTLVQFEDKLSS